MIEAFIAVVSHWWKTAVFQTQLLYVLRVDNDVLLNILVLKGNFKTL